MCSNPQPEPVQSESDSQEHAVHGECVNSVCGTQAACLCLAGCEFWVIPNVFVVVVLLVIAVCSTLGV